jgi:hypothetical protein
MAQKKPKTGDLFDRGPDHNYELVPLKAHRKERCITILHGELGPDFPRDVGVAVDYTALADGGATTNRETGERVKVWKVKGT